jgi:DnaJ homolog subfamily C member 25
MMRYNQEAYFQKYGANVLWQYAPQSDASIIIIVILIVGNWFTWWAQKNRWQNVADRLTKAAVEDWSPSMGGSDESKHLREEALQILAEKEEGENGAADASSAASASPAATKGKGKSKKGKEKVSGKEKKRQLEESLTPIVKDLVNKIDDFGAGFHKPTWRDLMIVRLVKFPVVFAKGSAWQIKYWSRRLRGIELNDEEREVLTHYAVGNVSWELASEEERKEMCTLELWKTENLAEWKEEQEIKQLSKADQKAYREWKKRGSKLD